MITECLLTGIKPYEVMIHESEPFLVIFIRYFWFDNSLNLSGHYAKQMNASILIKTISIQQFWHIPINQEQIRGYGKQSLTK